MTALRDEGNAAPLHIQRVGRDVRNFDWHESSFPETTR